jgi:tetratricopeptide (TPR) repeat protein
MSCISSLYKSLLIYSLVILVGCAANKKDGLVPMMYDYEISEVKALIDANKNLQAIEELDMLIQVNPDSEKAYELRGLANQKLERYDSAAMDYEQALAINPKSEKSHYNLGMIYGFKLGEKRLALSHFDQFLSLAPYHEQSFHVAKLMKSMDQSESDILNQADDIQVWIDKAQQLEDTHQKKQVLEEAAQRMDDTPIFYYLLGNEYAQKNNKEARSKALTYYNKALEIRPTCASCMEGKAEILKAMGQKAQYKVTQRKAALFSPTGP